MQKNLWKLFLPSTVLALIGAIPIVKLFADNSQTIKNSSKRIIEKSNCEYEKDLDFKNNSMEIIKKNVKKVSAIDTQCRYDKYTKEKISEFDNSKNNDLKKQLLGSQLFRKRLGIQLIKAIREGNMEDFKDLIKKGADVNVIDENGWTPLIHVSVSWESKNVKEMIDLLIENGAEVNFQDSGESCTALMWAVMNQNYDAVEALIENSDKFAQDISRATEEDYSDRLLNRYSPSKLSCKNRLNFDIRGFDLKDSSHNRKKTALDIACENNDVRIIQLLVENGALKEYGALEEYSKYYYDILDNNILNNNIVAKYLTFLNQVKANNVEEIKFYLNEMLFSVNTMVNKKTLFGYVVDELKNYEFAKFLIEKGVNPNAVNYEGQTNLECVASAKGNEDELLKIMKLLIETGKADINKRGMFGGTALIGAARNGNLGIVKFLKEKGASVDIQDNIGRTALIYAANKGHFEIVEYLGE